MPNEEKTNKRCLACHRDSQVTPLFRLEYLSSSFWICPQHVPMLIHDPGSLVGKLPGAENLSPAEHHN